VGFAPALPTLRKTQYASGLIEFWLSCIQVQQNKRLLAKVFLREDIYNQEVDVEDKSKIREGVSL